MKFPVIAAAVALLMVGAAVRATRAMATISRTRCSYENCPISKPDMLNVHLICHSHDDAGWVRTFDEYFWGRIANVQVDPGVRGILDSVTQELIQDPKKRFAFCETSFFAKWWQISNETVRQNFRKLVNEGRMEFIGGGWVQNDEAATDYKAIIDQMTLGHRFLRDTFGRCGVPKVAWQIDTFGHSRENCALMAQMGLIGLFFARIHVADRMRRQNDKSMEMIWDCSPNTVVKRNLFTSVFYEHYGPPNGFNFEGDIDSPQIVDDQNFSSFNVNERAKAFISIARTYAKAYATNHILMTMGGDFTYRTARTWFENLDKLIRYINQMQRSGLQVNVMYSTPACYLKALIDSGATFPIKNDDFFPYASEHNAYWTGYFTSRPTFKWFARHANNVLQICQVMDAASQRGMKNQQRIDVLREAVGIVQHHDAITGTSKQEVTEDYYRMLSRGIDACEAVLNNAWKKTTDKRINRRGLPDQTFCNWINCSVCQTSRESEKFMVTVYNGNSHHQNVVIRVPVNGVNYEVIDYQKKLVASEVFPTFVTNQTRHMMNGRFTQGPFDLVFKAVIPPLGYSSYFVSRKFNQFKAGNSTDSLSCQGVFTNLKNNFEKGAGRPCHFQTSELRDRGGASSTDDDIPDLVISNDFFKVYFNAQNGVMNSVLDKRSGRLLDISQRFFSYSGSDRWTSESRPSGAYVFQPGYLVPLPYGNGQVLNTKLSGVLVEEMRQMFMPWASQVVRLYKDKPYIEFEWTIGPLPKNNATNHADSTEVITRYLSSIANGPEFFTDSNGHQSVRRMRYSQPTFQISPGESLSSNYYPVTRYIYIKDNDQAMAVINDRSQGGSSVHDGSIELMLHRRLMYDDSLGVDEVLTELDNGKGLVARGRHWLVIDSPVEMSRILPLLSAEMFYQPLMTFASGLTAANLRKEFSTLTRALPPGVNIITLAAWNDNEILLRLEYFRSLTPRPSDIFPAVVKLQGLFSTFDITSIVELNLAGGEMPSKGRQPENSLVVELFNMEIRTFRCTIIRK